MRFVLLTAWRETRSAWQRLVFFFICLAIGVGAIVGSHGTRIDGSDPALFEQRLEPVGALALLAYDGVQVGDTGGPEVQPAGIEAAGHEQGPGHHEHDHGDEAPCVTLTMSGTAQRGACSLFGVA